MVSSSITNFNNVLKYPYIIFLNGDHEESSQGDISKEIPPKAGSGLIFKGLRPGDHIEYPVKNSILNP
jgi:hypothetical protein